MSAPPPSRAVPCRRGSNLANRWHADELATLRLLYPRGGVYACTRHLARRSPQAIRQRAHMLGIRMTRTGDVA